MKRLAHTFLLSAFIVLLLSPYKGIADSSVLNPQENLWLNERNSTIVVYPEKNFPPYSYQNSSGTPQGLSIDYIELIAEKIGAKIEYLPARSRSQILDDVKQNKKGDIITSLADTKEREDILYFTDTYVTTPAVIVVRKDLYKGQDLTLSDLTGKKVAIGKDFAVEEFVRTNNQRIVIESVVDDESGLQQVVLGEVDAAIMDITSLSYYLSKQVLSSVKVVGNTGFEYKLAFAVPKDKQILQSIIDKGLQQISTNDRQIIADKWVVVPSEEKSTNSFLEYIYKNSTTIVLYILICFIIVILLVRKRKASLSLRHRIKEGEISELQEEIEELEDTSRELMEELKTVKTLEQDIKNKIKNIDNK